MPLLKIYNLSMDISKLLKKDNHNIPLPDKVYNTLLRDILTGKLPKDTRLIESKICAMCGASRTPVREAFRRLEMDGLVEYIPNRGDFVRGLSDMEVSDMLCMRLDLEVRAIRWCVRRISKEKLSELADIFRYMEFYTGKKDISKMININLAFHQAIYNSTRDTILKKTLTSYQEYTNYCCPPNYFERGYLESVLAEHRSIFSAIMEKDEEAAASAMRIHMTNTIKRSKTITAGP